MYSSANNYAVEVMFRNQRVAEKYQRRIKDFLNKLLESEDQPCVRYEIRKDDDEVDIEDVIFNTFGESCSAKNIPIPHTLPIYEASYEEVLGDKGKEQTTNPNKSQKMTCFNCLGDHHLKDCPEQHDGSRIASNKREIMESMQNTSRYHTDDVQPLEYSMLKPGRFSKELRKALDVRSNQLPLFVYRMRILGYPPGWMKEAEIESSGISVYGGSCGNVEDGELPEASENIKYNSQHFVEFPGFNVPVPDGVIDEWRELNMLPMQPHQQLSEALKHTHVTNSPDFKKRKKTADADNSLKKQRSGNDKGDVAAEDSESNVSNLDDSFQGKRDKPPVVIGSPLIDTGNPYKKLPDSNKFAVGITEHLPYENLPDAVGQFESKMRGVLDDVRTKMTNLSNHEM